jgi:leader peptidase (prepilin peptidase)/N-methyltransferase
MNFSLYFLLFIFGTIVGSFLNVIILRHNTGQSINGRSHCFTCGRRISWYELVPVLSFGALLGRCRNCKARISWQYPLVEVFTGLILTLLAWQMGILYEYSHLQLLSFLISVVLWCNLIIIFVYDLRHQIIPDTFSLSFALLALLLAILPCLTDACSLTSIFYRLLAGGVLFSFFFLLWFVSGGKWVGFGDGKLAFGIGIYLGFAKGLSALAFAFWIGAIVGLLLIMRGKIRHYLGGKHLKSEQKDFTIKSAIPFAPFLIIGTLIALVFQSDIFGLHNIF